MATVTYSRQDTGRSGGGTGRVVRIIGPVLDVEFAPDEMPAINNALTVERTLDGETTTITCEVAQHIGDSLVRAIAMSPTDGLVKGTPVVDRAHDDAGGEPGARLQRAQRNPRRPRLPGR